MVQRTKRRLSPGEAERMQKELRAFHSSVRIWCSKVPVGETVYVALDSLNSALILTDRELQGAIDGERMAWPPGWQGLPS